MIRLFIAIELPEEIKSDLERICHGLPGVRWTPVAQMHLTLRFIGEVNSQQLDTLRSVLESVRQPSFRLALSGVGQFLNGRDPRVLWVGVDAPAELVQLQQQVEKGVQSVGHDPEKRKYMPHITLTRLKSINRRRLQEYLEMFADYRSPEFQVTEFSLFSSTLQPRGAVHKIQCSYPLEG